ncbi:protease Lon-related BREX system protein BrxL [uncultured Thiocystis sp.]|jgi:ATP-dependent Lon protease|uniref:protease Lon-related BREX system protein BrxL n=1 Tax=uncultured Thiocystis sp. TaxID=1202134 RepID=UPI0025D036B9|nr:protease Lon-related BREX system protein BrxL [uncultured Thiocystis sp.]
MELDALDRKLNDAFPGKVVRKDLLHQIKGGENVPSYVLEYLLGRYCASDNEEEVQLGIEAVKETLRKNYFRQDEANKAKALVERHGHYRFIDRIEVRFIPSEMKYWAAMDNFGFQRIHIPDEFHRRYDRLLEGGIWAIVDLEYRPSEETGRNVSPFHVRDLKPIQLARFDFEEYCEQRRAFTTDEWINVLLRSTGLESERLDDRRKRLLLTRLLAMVEKNYNFIELGPRGTGKSYAYSEFTPYAILLSGGKASTANLFYNNARRQVGLVGHWDVVAFDEVGGMKVTDADTIQIMKDYMANGRFSRGITQVHADASMVFIGNLNHPIETLVSQSAMDLFQPLPKEFDLALIDRFHFYLPGWEIPKNSQALLTDHYGFVTDYLAEALRTLRKENRFDALDGEFRLGAHVEGRDANAIRRTVSGLLKLFHPHGEWTRDELRGYLELAMEARRRVKEQLKKRGAFEFYRTSFSYIDEIDGREVTVGVPEQGSQGMISQDVLAPGSAYTATVDGESKVSLLRIEVTFSPGTGKLRLPSGMPRGIRESLNRAWTYLQSIKDRVGLTSTLAARDFAAEIVDLSGGGAEAECGVAFFVAIMSALQNRSVEGGTIILGDLTIQGNIKPPVSIIEPLQVALDNGALRTLVPVGNKKQIAQLPEEVVEKLDIVFYGDLDRAVIRSLVG